MMHGQTQIKNESLLIVFQTKKLLKKTDADRHYVKSAKCTLWAGRDQQQMNH